MKERATHRGPVCPLGIRINAILLAAIRAGKVCAARGTATVVGCTLIHVFARRILVDKRVLRADHEEGVAMLAGRVPFVTRNAHSLIQAQLARGVDACVCERWNVAKDGGARHVADQVRWWGARAFDAATGIVADILAPAVDAPCLSRLLWVEALDVCTRLCAGSLLRGMQIPARCGGMNDNNKIKDTHTHTHTHTHTQRKSKRQGPARA